MYAFDAAKQIKQKQLANTLENLAHYSDDGKFV